jgi:hypothetical protein
MDARTRRIDLLFILPLTSNDGASAAIAAAADASD